MPLLTRNEASVDHQRLAGDEGGGVGAEPDDRFGDLLRPTEAAHGVPAGYPLTDRLILQRAASR
jgi:hypothetical protein